MTTVRITQQQFEPIHCHIETYDDYIFFTKDLENLKEIRMKAEEDLKTLVEAGSFTYEKRQEKIDSLAEHIRREDSVQKELARFQSKWNRRVAIGAITLGSVVAASIAFWIKRR